MFGLGEAADAMRQKMILQSMRNPENASGVSAGVNGDGFKLGGGRRHANIPLNEEIPSPLGGVQGGEGEIFKLKYGAGSFGDNLVESYSGPHDYLNNPFSYDGLGNINTSLSAVEKVFGSVMNIVNIPVATPFVLGQTLSLYAPTWSYQHNTLKNEY